MNPRTGSPAGNIAPAYTSEIPETPGYYVYRLWAGDVCLYVGRIGDSGPRPPQGRLKQHRLGKDWWPEVTRIEVAGLPDHPAIVAEEGEQIRLLRPRFNVHRTKCAHDLSVPGAVKKSGECRECAKAYRRTPEGKAAQRAYEADPATKTRKSEYARAYQPRKNAAKRLRRRAPGRDQGNLW